MTLYNKQHSVLELTLKGNSSRNGRIKMEIFLKENVTSSIYLIKHSFSLPNCKEKIVLI
jgi:hypothetical protein